ncbi:MAG: cytochrome b N-terminal domain-containing protein [Desulfofustis sp.]|nr:cytochrome b N-terminal domain-containing protein [Desulfofustis sp.]
MIADALGALKWGDWSLISLYISLISGIVVGIHYSPAEPFYSASALDILVPYGGFFRSLHFYSSQFFFLFGVAHYWAVFNKAQNITSRAYLYLILCFPCMLMLLFTGYVLRADATGYSAGMIAEHILEAVPLIGSGLNNTLFSISTHGMDRVYLHHVISFDLLFLFLAWDHLRRYRVFLTDHLLFISALLLFSLVVAAPMDPDQLGMLYITGPWFFLGLQELLRYISPFVAGILVPISLLVALIFLRKEQRYFRPLLVFICSWLALYLILTLLALTSHG